MNGKDYTARNDYYRKARICPCCGSDDKVSASAHPVGGLLIREYKCMGCGREWEVEPYREEGETENSVPKDIDVRHLIVYYPSCDHKPEYELPIICRARDMGKVIYGKWIIGGDQWLEFNAEPRPTDELSVYIAHKLVRGATVAGNVELNIDPSIVDASEEEPEIEVSVSGIKYMKMPKGQEA